MWDAQGGQCYLCGDQLSREATVVDHDHDCCPPKKSCAFCRRGLACHLCNTSIGLQHDDPDRLVRIAANLRAALATVAQRQTVRPVQELLIDLPGTDVARR